MSSDAKSAEASRLAGVIRGWMLIVPPLGLVAIATLTAFNIGTGGDLNRRIVSNPQLFRVGFFAGIVLNLTIWGALIRVARLPLVWKTRLDLMAWCGLAWAFAIPLLELVVMPEADGLPPATCDDAGDTSRDDAWQRAVHRFRRLCWWALGIYVLVVAEIAGGAALWSMWRA